MNSAGDKVAELRYHPFGSTRYTWGTTPTERRYTGQIQDAGTGLYFYNARYYDPTLARFTQPDTIVPEPGNPQALNRYSYTLNNPVKYTDPTGHFTVEAIATYMSDTYGDEYGEIWQQWINDEAWWQMLLQAEAGDTLALLGDDGSTTWLTFTGQGRTQLSGAELVSGPGGVKVTGSGQLNGQQLNDLRRSSQFVGGLFGMDAGGQIFARWMQHSQIRKGKLAAISVNFHTVTHWEHLQMVAGLASFEEVAGIGAGGVATWAFGKIGAGKWARGAGGLAAGILAGVAISSWEGPFLNPVAGSQIVTLNVKISDNPVRSGYSPYSRWYEVTSVGIPVSNGYDWSTSVNRRYYR